ncbi:hypothetical protein AGMMS50239_39470 [Bacteroidia bacterium]|nr:hypothetical protein AGMMS50239_39470 [Bacteroidia bacterium]
MYIYMTKDMINRFVFSLIYSVEISGKDALECTKTYHDDYCIKTIEKVFALYDAYDIRIEQLDIDLGEISPSEIPSRLFDRLDNELRKHIREQGLLPASHQPVKSESRLTDHPLFNFLSYLQSPHVPWFFSDEKLFDIESLALTAIDICMADNTSMQQLVSVISQNQSAYYRFTHLVSAAVLDRIVRKYIAMNKPLPTDVTDEYDKIGYRQPSSPAYSNKEAIVRFFDILLYGSLSSGKSEQQSEYDMEQEEFDEHLLYDSQPLSKNDLLSKYDMEQKESEDRLLYDSQPLSKNDQLSKYDMEQKESEERLRHNSLPLSKNDQRSEYGIEQIKEDTFTRSTKPNFPVAMKYIPVFNAGIALLHPMLPSFFKRLEYLNEEGTFKSPYHQVRAVHLLQAFTGEQTKHYDHLLHLNKIICGLDISFPVNPLFRATANEKEEILSLLESVIIHWKILKGTSVNGLQESFIRRKGVLEKSERDWILRVENKGIDILLNDLPWAISLLSLPWNDFLIHVDWKK